MSVNLVAPSPRVCVYIKTWMAEVATAAEGVREEQVAQVADILGHVRARGGRLFVLGNGGSASNASHAVCDFRRLARLESYAPPDNLAENSGNDWPQSVSRWLRESHLCSFDAILVLSIDTDNQNLVAAAQLAREVGASVLAILGNREDLVAQHAHATVAIPCPSPQRHVYHTESFQGVICHLLASLLAEGTW